MEINGRNKGVVTSIGFPAFSVGNQYITEWFPPADGEAPSVANQIQLTSGDSGGATLLLSDPANPFDPVNAQLVALNDFELGNYSYSGKLLSRLQALNRPNKRLCQAWHSCAHDGIACGAAVLYLRRRRSLLAGLARGLLQCALALGILFVCGRAQAGVIPNGGNDADYIAAGQQSIYASVGSLTLYDSSGNAMPMVVRFLLPRTGSC